MAMLAPPELVRLTRGRTVDLVAMRRWAGPRRNCRIRIIR